MSLQRKFLLNVILMCVANFLVKVIITQFFLLNSNSLYQYVV